MRSWPASEVLTPLLWGPERQRTHGDSSALTDHVLANIWCAPGCSNRCEVARGPKPAAICARGGGRSIGVAAIRQAAGEAGFDMVSVAHAAANGSGWLSVSLGKSGAPTPTVAGQTG